MPSWVWSHLGSGGGTKACCAAKEAGEGATATLSRAAALSPPTRPAGRRGTAGGGQRREGPRGVAALQLRRCIVVRIQEVLHRGNGSQETGV